MPELPEVETTLRGIAPLLEGQVLRRVALNAPALRLPMVPEWAGLLEGRRVVRLVRRAKYMILELDDGAAAVVHLGMSGRFVILEPQKALPKHGHVELVTDKGRLVLVDPRRFGIFLRVEGDWRTHALMARLGPEPLEENFTPAGLWAALQKTSIPVKVALMDNKVVVGVGNIYASESLFRAGILPGRPADRVTKAEAVRVHAAVRDVLAEAIKAGGSTLRDYAQPGGELGYFAHEFAVYGRAGQACRTCGAAIEKAVMGQRATFWCAKCQK